ATLGDAAALTTLEATLRGWPAGPETAALTQVAVRAIAAAPRPEAVRLVLAGLRDRDPGVRLAALAALAGSESDATGAWSSAGRDAIDRAIADASGEDDWPEVRRRAAVALGARCQRRVPRDRPGRGPGPRRPRPRLPARRQGSPRRARSLRQPGRRSRQARRRAMREIAASAVMILAISKSI